MNTPKLIKLFKQLYIGDLDERSKQQLLDSSEANQLLTEQWNHPEKAADNQPEPDFDKLFHKISDSIEKNDRQVFFTFRKIAASIIILIGLASMAYFYLQSKEDPIILVTNHYDSNKELTLPDGSVVVMDKNAELKYASDFEPREVTLSGRSFFKVIHNNSPFKVIAGNHAIEVLGTSFSVFNSQQSDIFEVVLLEGKVSISNEKGNQRIEVQPNEKITVNKQTSSFTKVPVSAQEQLLWKEPSLVVNNNTFEELAILLEKRFNKTFILSNDIKDQRFTLTLREETLDESVQLLNIIGSVRSEMKNDTVFFEKR
jgi:transmembrane sensor